jgi:hypothetical protein
MFLECVSLKNVMKDAFLLSVKFYSFDFKAAFIHSFSLDLPKGHQYNFGMTAG